MKDEPAERPVLKALIVRCMWTRGPSAHVLMRHPHSFAVIDFLSLPQYQDMGWQFVALDPDSELAWNIWRAKNPEAA